MRLFALLLTGLFALILTPFASADNEALMTSLKQPDLETLIDFFEAEEIEAPGAPVQLHFEKSHSIQYWNDEGERAFEAIPIQYALQGNACDPSGTTCLGLMVVSFHEDKGSLTVEEIFALNQQSAVTRIFRLGETIITDRYMILDHGVTRNNLRANIANFISANEKISELAYRAYWLRVHGEQR